MAEWRRNASNVSVAVEDVNLSSSSDPEMDADVEAGIEIGDTNEKFKKACQQLILLNNYIESIQVRYDRASKNARRTARYNYRIKLCVVEGVRNMFYEYAVRLADQIDDMRRQAGMIVIREESDDDMDLEEAEEDEWGEDGYHSDNEPEDAEEIDAETGREQQGSAGPGGPPALPPGGRH